jgi:excisionase family DNA binding protein
VSARAAAADDRAAGGHLLLVDVPPELAAYLALAVRRLGEDLRRDGSRLPPLVAEFGVAMSARATAGHSRPGLADLPLEPESGSRGVLLWSRDEAARMLAVSVRSVSRLVASGELRPVKVLGATRFRREDLEAYAAGLTPTDDDVEAQA